MPCLIKYALSVNIRPRPLSEADCHWPGPGGTQETSLHSEGREQPSHGQQTERCRASCFSKGLLKSLNSDILYIGLKEEILERVYRLLSALSEVETTESLRVLPVLALAGAGEFRERSLPGLESWPVCTCVLLVYCMLPVFMYCTYVYCTCIACYLCISVHVHMCTASLLNGTGILHMFYMILVYCYVMWVHVSTLFVL